MPEKKKSLLETELMLEMKPADARKYLERGFEALLDIAEDKSAGKMERIKAVDIVDNLYMRLIMKDGLDEGLTRVDRTNNRAIDEVRKLRGKDNNTWNDGEA